VNQRPLSQVLFGLLIVAVGVSALLVQLGAVEVDLGKLIATWWPLLIVLAGAAALVSVPRAWIGPTTVNSAVIWWGSERRTTSRDFRGGSLSAIMGGISADLRQADIVDRAEISVFVFWGGADIKN